MSWLYSQALVEEYSEGISFGWRTVCAVEWEPYAACVLAARQNDGLLPPFPIWDDVQTFDGRPWRGIVDVVSGGFPCQDISIAGRGDGLEGQRSGMWKHMARVVGEVRPRFVFVENSPMLTSRGGTRVIADLTALGYDCRWGVIGAADCGGPHKRDRIWIVAHTTSAGRDERRIQNEGSGGCSFEQRASIGIGESGCSSSSMADPNGMRELQPQRVKRDQRRWASNGSTEMADPNGTYGEGNECSQRSTSQRTVSVQPSWWDIEPDVGRVANGVAARVDRLKAIGNGQVPAVAATAWRLLA